MAIDTSFWKDRQVFVTGHTGFKGTWLCLWLNQLGAIVTGYALEPSSSPSMFDIVELNNVIERNIYADIRDPDTLSRALEDSRPEVVIHMAAQSLVRESFENPVDTFSTNIMGTINLLDSIRQSDSVKVVLVITSDKCYENTGKITGYTENDPMGGYDPYSSSKGCTELVCSAYRRSFLAESGVLLATCRAGNVIGGGDWAKDRFIPDAIRAFLGNESLLVRNPAAVRPWQHVLEPLSGYLVLGQKLMRDSGNFSEGWNFGPDEQDCVPVSELADSLVKIWGENARWQQDDASHPHEELALRLDCTKSAECLNWKPVWCLGRALDETVNWYKTWYTEEDVQKFTLDQIQQYQIERNGACQQGLN